MMARMLTPDELTALEGLLLRARIEAARDRNAVAEAITPGDIVQLRPGASPTWETSILLVMTAEAHHVRGQVLKPHRSGCREAWASFSAADVARIGRAPFTEPAPDVKAWCYEPPCPLLASPEQIARYRRAQELTWKRLKAEQLFIYQQEKRPRKATT